MAYGFNDDKSKFDLKTIITPPDFGSIDYIWTENYGSAGSDFSVTHTVENAGWFSLAVRRSESSSIGYISGKVMVGSEEYAAAISATPTTETYLMTQWLYFESGESFSIRGHANTALLQYAPCL